MNKIQGKIIDIQSSGNISMIYVDVNGDVFSSLVLDGEGIVKFQIKDSVTLLFKETEVGIAKNLNGMISLRNRFKSTIQKIDKGPILAKITLNYKNHVMESIISAQSAIQMKLVEKEEVEWLVKSNEVSLIKNS